MKMKALFTGYQLVAGLCDTSTGLLLLVCPAFTLSIMGISREVTEPVLISFIGAFVFGVGLSYLVYATAPRSPSRRAEVKGAWLITALVRLSVGTFVLAGYISGELEGAWLAVSVVDLSLAAFQLMAREKLIESLA